MSDEQLLEKVTTKMQHSRTDYCSLNWKEAPFEQIQRIAKKLGRKAEQGLLCHSILKGGAQVAFGGEK